MKILFQSDAGIISCNVFFDSVEGAHIVVTWAIAVTWSASLSLTFIVVDNLLAGASKTSSRVSRKGLHAWALHEQVVCSSTEITRRASQIGHCTDSKVVLSVEEIDGKGAIGP